MIETGDFSVDNRLVSPVETQEDYVLEKGLRPQTLAEYIGQDKVKENLAICPQVAPMDLQTPQ